jgi:undecaprenyl-diphosphatase
MELNWLEYLIYGLISGFGEFFPVSSLAHQTIFLKLLGINDHPWLRFSAHVGALLAVLIVFTPTLLRLRRERRIAAIPKKRRRRQPDFATLMESRVFRMTSISMMVLYFGYPLVAGVEQRLWILAALLGINGVVLYIPQYLPRSNKTAQSLSSLDTMLIGLAAGSGMIPGISRVGAAISIGQIRGADRHYAADLALMLSIPALLLMSLLQLFGAFAVPALGAVLILPCLLVTITSFAASYLAIYLMRFLAVRVGYEVFAYYSWGVALFTLILYLI